MHEMVYFVRKANWKKFPAQTKQFRNYAKYNGESFCSDLNNVDWESIGNPTEDANYRLMSTGQILK